MDGIFISYRREDSAGYAGRLYDRLSAHFGAERVFMDVEGIAPGTDFVDAIEKAVTSCKVLIVLIGNEWTDIADGNGRRRLDDPNDFIRVETSTALKRNIRVVPVLLEGTEMPRSEELPEELVALSRRQAIEISHRQWEASTGNLIETLDKIFYPSAVTARPVSSSQDGPDKVQRSHFRRIGLWVAAGLLPVLAVGGWLLVRTLPQALPPPSSPVGPAISTSAIPQPTAPAGRLEAQPRRIDFGTITVGTSSMASVTLRNAGDAEVVAPVPLLEGGKSGDITFKSNCPGELQPRENCTIELRFKPRETGPLDTRFSIDRPDGPGIAIMLSGSAEATPVPPVSRTILTAKPESLPIVAAAPARPPNAAFSASEIKPTPPVTVVTAATAKPMPPSAVAIASIAKPSPPPAVAEASIAKPSPPPAAAIASTAKPTPPPAAAIASTAKPTPPPAVAEASIAKPTPLPAVITKPEAKATKPAPRVTTAKLDKPAPPSVPLKTPVSPSAPGRATIPKIKSFTATVKGDAAKLCYQVTDAEQLTITPKPGRLRNLDKDCATVRIAERTTFKITARGKNRRVSDSLVVMPERTTIAHRQPVTAAVIPAPRTATHDRLPNARDQWTYKVKGRWRSTPVRKIQISAVSVDPKAVKESLSMLGSDSARQEDERFVRGAVPYVTKSDYLGTEFSPYLAAFGGIENESGWRDIPTPDTNSFWTNWYSTGKVKGMESVTVPAGEFHAVKVDISSSRSGSGSRTEDNVEPVRVRYRIWYAPEVKRYVKMVRTTTAASGQTIDKDTFELVSYQQN